MISKFLVAAFACAGMASAVAQSLPEAGPVVPAAELLTPAQLRGPQFTVAADVPVVNYLGQFQLSSPYGMFAVSGRRVLSVRESELPAIQALDQVNQSEAFQQSLAQAATAPVQLVRSAVTNPAGTVENLATGFGTILGRIGRVAEMGANAVVDGASDLQSGAAQARPRRRWRASRCRRFSSATRSATTRRGASGRRSSTSIRTPPTPSCAPSSTRWPPRALLGSFAIESAMSIVAAPLQYAVEFDGTVRDAVWNTPAIDLETRNQERLAQMGIDGRVVRDFFRNRWFTPTLQTALVTALERFAGASGRESVVRNAIGVQGEVRARALIYGLRTLAAYQAAGHSLTTVTANGVLAVGVTARGERVVAADLDYVWWSEQTAAFAKRGMEARRKIALVTGLVTPEARQGLERARLARGGERAGGVTPARDQSRRTSAMAATIIAMKNTKVHDGIASPRKTQPCSAHSPLPFNTREMTSVSGRVSSM